MALEDEIAQKNKFTSLYEKGLVNILYTNNWLTAQLKDFLKQFDLTLQQYNILRILRGQHPEPATINLLKDRMLDKMSDTSRIVERLRVKGFLERKSCEGDRRSVDILITGKGLEVLERIDGQIENINKLMDNLTNEELDELNRLLDKIRRRKK